MTALAFTTTPSNWRRVAHIISDKIYEDLTGEEGYFDTRIIYVAEVGQKIKELKNLQLWIKMALIQNILLWVMNLFLLLGLIQQTKWLLTCLILEICLECTCLISKRNSRGGRKFPRNDICAKIFSRWKKNYYEFC